MDKPVFSERVLANFASREQMFDHIIDDYIWAEKYLYYYIYVVETERDSIIHILDTIEECDRASFSPRKAYKYLKAYEKKRLDFAVIIPTCNRPEAVKYLIDHSAFLYRRYGIDIIIYDSSTNDETKLIVEKIQSNGYYNVIYSRYTGIFDGFSLDHKLMGAYEQFYEQYEYIWMCRDGLIPVIDEFIEKMRYYSRNRVECIIVDTKSRNDDMDIEKYYTSIEDCATLLKEQASRLQTLGMLIFSKSLIKSLLIDEPLNDSNYSLWQMAAPFHRFAKKPYRIVFLVKNVFAQNEGAYSAHFWSKADKMLEQWAHNWYNVIMNMPKEYEPVKEECLKLYTVDFHPFTAKSVLEMRGWGGLNRKMVQKHKEYIPHVTETPLWYFYLVSLIPRWIVRIAFKTALHTPNISRKVNRSLFDPRYR